MELLTGLGLSWRAISDHKLRSMLTTLGVVIGVAAVITFVTLGTSLQADVVNTLAGGDQNVVTVTAVSDTQAGIAGLGGGGTAVFTQHDVALLGRTPGVAAAVPQGGLAAAGVGYRNDTVGRQWITVTTPAYFEAQGRSFAAGRPFQEGRPEVVLNAQAATMFEENVTVGSNVTIVPGATQRPVNATVVGILRPTSAESGGTLLSAPDRPAIYAPTDPYYGRRVSSPATGSYQRVYPEVLVVATDTTNVESLKGRLQSRLAASSDAHLILPEGYHLSVATYQDRVSKLREISSTFTAYVVGIALISLVVGAIGIANIMLANVAERRREIGIMKAIGARNRDVVQLFLNEAVLLGLLGALLGTVVGVAGAFVGTELIKLPFVMDVVWLPVAIAVGVGVGVVAGLYPAWSAARTDPIEALRYE